jgi:hypothetical protein
MKNADSGSKGHFAGWNYMLSIVHWKRHIIFAMQPEAQHGSAGEQPCQE